MKVLAVSVLGENKILEGFKSWSCYKILQKSLDLYGLLYSWSSCGLKAVVQLITHCH